MILLRAPCKTFRRQDLRVPACSKGAIGIFIPFITLIAIVPMLVARQLSLGVVSWPIKSTGKATRVSLPEPIKLSDTENESSRRKQLQWLNQRKNMPKTDRARAITKNNPIKNLAVNGLVATGDSIHTLAHPIKNTVDLNVTRPCDAF